MKPVTKNRKIIIQIQTLLFASLLIGFIIAGKVLAGGNAAALGGERSILNRQGLLSVNQLNGQAFFNITLATISCKSGLKATADLSYSSMNIYRKVDAPNEDVNVGCAGLGWNLGTSYIQVLHNNTVNIDDDRWFLHFSSGGASEIVKAPGSENFKIKSDPASIVIPHYEVNSPIIDGWTITQSDGSVLKFGDFGGAVNANRYVQCQDDVISANLTGITRKFYYQWDMSITTDINQNSLNYTYYQVTRNTTPTNLSYTRDSYLWMVQSNTGDKIWFDYMDKSNAEGRLVTPPSPSYNIFERMYLTRIRLLNSDGLVMDTLIFSYSLLNTGITGKEKRLLTGITSKMGTGALDHVFSYSGEPSYKGYLVTISNPKLGKRLTFNIINGVPNKGHSDNYVVNWTRTSGGTFGPVDLTTGYRYTTDPNQQYYDEEYGIAYWGVVTQNSGTGDIKSTYDIDFTGNTFGTLKQVETYNTDGTKLVASQMIDYAAISLPNWRFTVPTDIVNTTNGVSQKSGTPQMECGIDFTNLQTNFTYVVNSDGTALCTEKTFAYDVYGSMFSANMLLQAAGVKTYKIPNYAFNCNLTNAVVLNATFTTWSDISGTWRPAASYVWNVPMNELGNPRIPFVDFDKNSPSANNWKCTGTFDRYDEHGHLLQSSNAKGIPSSMIYGTRSALPIGSIRNASFVESGIFSCDYDLNEPVAGYFSYFDKENGWEKSYGTVVSTPANRLHYGQKVLRIENGEGAMRNFKIQPNKEYVASAWVYVESGSGNGFYLWAEVRKGAAPADVWPHRYGNLPAVTSSVTSEKLTTTGGKWQLVKVKVPAQLDPGSGNELWVRFTVGRNGEAFLAYVDDIRFSPKNAMVTSTYYDQKWYQPILSVDANNNPSQNVEHDDFGRPVKWFKIDKTNPSSRTLLKQKQYHLQGDFHDPYPDKWYKIVSAANENFCIELSGATWIDGRPVQLFTYSNNTHMQWKFVPAGDGCYNLVGRGDPSFGIAYDAIASETPLKIRSLSGTTPSAEHKKWKLTDAGKGYCRISAKLNDAAYIDVKDGEMENETILQIQQDGINTKWKLVEVP